MEPIYTSILAPNASLMTGPGTNTLVVGAPDRAGALVIDPADADPAHLARIIQSGELRGGIRKILITHGHPDHLGGAVELREQLHAPIYAFNRRGVPVLDYELSDGMSLQVGGDTLRAIHTPGHRFDHLCFLLEGAQILFAGDHLSGVTTSVISPLDGDMQDYLHSLQRLQTLAISQLVPAHGSVVDNPQEKIANSLLHRLQREQQILKILQRSDVGVTVSQLVTEIYQEINPELHFAAAHTIEAHLLKLEKEMYIGYKNGFWMYSKHM